MQRIIFHIGDKKTGSTSIQQALVRGACHCDTVSVDYVVSPEMPYHHDVAFSMRWGHPLAAKQRFAELARRITASKADVVVVSSELFRDVDPEALDTMLRRHLRRQRSQVEILAYLRPHASRMPSSYAQEVKLGYFIGMPDAYFEATQARGQYDYARIFGAWKDVFGDRMTVRPMVRSLLRDQDVIADFFEQVLGRAAFDLAPLPDTNNSPGLEDLALLRRFHELLREYGPDQPDEALRSARMRIGERLGDLLCDTPRAGATKLRLHRALVERIADAYAGDAAACDERFFDGTPMQDGLASALRNAPEEAQSLWAKDHFSPEIQRNLMVWAQLVTDMLKHGTDGWDGHFMALLNSTLRG